MMNVSMPANKLIMMKVLVVLGVLTRRGLVALLKIIYLCQYDSEVACSPAMRKVSS